MGFFRPAWKSENESKRLNFVMKTNQEEILRMLAAQDTSSLVRARAIFRIQDQAYLKSLWPEEKSTPVQLALINQIRDKSFLLYCIRSLPSADKPDEQVLVALARAVGTDEARALAACRIPSWRDASINLVKKIQDKEWRVYIAKNTPEESECLYMFPEYGNLDEWDDIDPDTLGKAAAKQLREYREKRARTRATEAERVFALTHCPDGSLHEFDKRRCERVDNGSRSDDDWAAHEWSNYRSWACYNT